jgi:hypothetical protein
MAAGRLKGATADPAGAGRQIFAAFDVPGAAAAGDRTIDLVGGADGVLAATGGAAADALGAAVAIHGLPTAGRAVNARATGVTVDDEGGMTGGAATQGPAATDAEIDATLGEGVEGRRRDDRPGLEEGALALTAPVVGAPAGGRTELLALADDIVDKGAATVTADQDVDAARETDEQATLEGGVEGAELLIPAGDLADGGAAAALEVGLGRAVTPSTAVTLAAGVGAGFARTATRGLRDGPVADQAVGQARAGWVGHMAYGLWLMADSIWLMANSVWLMADGR